MFCYDASIICLCLGLRLQGAKCVNNRLELAAVISNDLPLTSLSWIRYVYREEVLIDIVQIA